MRKPKAQSSKHKLNLIREMMDKKKITRYKMAKDTGITYVSINNYYLGRQEPSLDRLFLIAKALEVSPKDLLNCE
jgi:putative transcriptional regulator